MVVQVASAGKSGWTRIDNSELSPMGAFGYRQRLDRILQETNRRPVSGDVTERLAVWVAAKYREKHPDEREVVAVRFGKTVWESKSAELARPTSRWIPHPLSGNPMIPFKSFATYAIIKGIAKPMVDAGTLRRTSVPTPVSSHERPNYVVPKPVTHAAQAPRDFAAPAASAAPASHEPNAP